MQAIAKSYRPICLLNSAYKVFAMVILQRLLSAGADSRLWASQFGFRRGRSTEQALHCARRAIDLAASQQLGTLSLLALDWARAFDSISCDGLLNALARFGLPNRLLEIVRSIYTNREFKVRDAGALSSVSGRQHSGVCQGCPLSPFLFCILMTVLMDDAYKQLGIDAQAEHRQGRLYDVLYADDTLIIGANSVFVTELALAVESAGSRYGMLLHWGKTQLVSIGNAGPVVDTDGVPIEPADSIIYLGGLLSPSACSGSELARRIGLAAAEFRSLQKLWGHASVGRNDKLKFLDAFVVSKLLYGLSTVVLVKAQKRRLDGFYARCLRRALGIPPAFVSQISNASVFRQAGVPPMSEQLSKQQLSVLRQAAIAPEGDPLRRNVFAGGSLDPLVDKYVRRVGRPKLNWTKELLKEGSVRFGSYEAFSRALLLPTKEQWRSELDRIYQ